MFKTNPYHCVLTNMHFISNMRFEYRMYLIPTFFKLFFKSLLGHSTGLSKPFTSPFFSERERMRERASLKILQLRA